MPKIEVEIFINAPIDLCFDLARDIDLHSKTVWKHTCEKAIAGIVKGRIEWNQEVTFVARHFGIKQKLCAKVVEYDRPQHFVDEMQWGAFKYMRHTHLFRESGEGTVMTDILDFSSPLGMMGTIFDRIVLKGYMRAFLKYRQRKLKGFAEGR